MKSTRPNRQSKEELHSCIWMQAGVVPRKFCEKNYSCTSCKFDRALQKVAEQNNKLFQEGRVLKGKRGKIISWKDKLRERLPWRQPCLHHMKGHIEFRACNYDYRCSNCAFDQYLHDQITVHAEVKPVDALEVKGFQIPQGYYIHPGHTWIKVEEGAAVRVGIDEFALRLLGPFDRIEAPLMGKKVKQGRADTVASRGQLRATILSPVSGVVTAINPELRDDGFLANDSPYERGWVMSVHATDIRRDLKNLMINSETEDFMENQVDSLYQLIEEVAGPLSADGGDLGNDIYGNMPQLGWERLTGLFLKT
ncbi:MAG: glycine cleavage system protein H [Deltaproteobacteria bacterium]|nr:glycine cleavage system protein H [Deltaproteobacteria bacterium]MBW2116961.1 glycine cleavage system protein H [Deltaproteobacteria bacterium]MBW2344865.1 glycine cleavage system protein H [Deltaproteobacteria bacterium]